MPSPPSLPPSDRVPEPFEIDLLVHRQALEALIALCPDIAWMLVDYLEQHGDNIDDDLSEFLANLVTIFDSMIGHNVNLMDGTKIVALSRQLEKVEDDIELFQADQPTKASHYDPDPTEHNP